MENIKGVVSTIGTVVTTVLDAIFNNEKTLRELGVPKSDIIE